MSYILLFSHLDRDAVVVTIVNCVTSFYGGFLIFSVIGFMAHEAGLEVEEVITAGQQQL